MSTKTAPVERERRVDHLGFLRQTVHELAGYDALAYELIQNADDAEGASSLGLTSEGARSSLRTMVASLTACIKNRIRRIVRFSRKGHTCATSIPFGP